MMMDKENHVLESFLDLGLPGDLVAGLKNGLDHFRAATRAGAAHPSAAPAMMRPQIAALDVQDRLGHGPAQGGFQNVHGSRDRGWRILALEKINYCGSFRRNHLSQMQ